MISRRSLNYYLLYSNSLSQHKAQGDRYYCRSWFLGDRIYFSSLSISSFTNQGLLRCIILWQLEHTKIKSSNFVSVASVNSEIGKMWWASINLSPSSPYCSLKENLHISQGRFGFTNSAFCFFIATSFWFLSFDLWTIS